MASWRERQQKKDTKPGLEVNEIHFPSLHAEEWKNKDVESKKFTKSFAVLAEEWNEKNEIERLRKEIQEADQKARENERALFRKLRYDFGNSHSNEEDTYYEDHHEETAPATDEWTDVIRKPKKSKSAFDGKLFRHQRPPTPVEESSVWVDDEL